MKPSSLMLGAAAAVLSLQPTELGTTAFAPPTASIFRRTGRLRQHTSSLPSSADSGSSSSGSSSGNSDSGDFSFNDLQQELLKRRAEEAAAAAAEAAEAEAEAETASATGASASGLEEGDAFMEEQMMLRKKLLKAFVLVYNQGQPEEGVYTLFVQGRNVLRAWQDKAEAARYALMLRAEDLPLGKPTELPMSQITGFCKDNGVGLELVPPGRGLQPPSRNKPEFDFDCTSPPSQGHDHYGGGTSSPSAQAGGGAAEAERRRRDESLFSPQELARIKKQFEKSLEATSEDE